MTQATSIKNNYAALARYAQKAAHVPDDALALVAFYDNRGDLAKVRCALARGVLQRHRPEELAWLFGSDEARTLGFSLTMDVRPRLGVTPLTWAISHRRQGLFERLLALGADPTFQHPQGPNAWRALVDEAPLHQAPPLQLMARMREVGVPFASSYQESALAAAFSRRIVHRADGRVIVRPTNLSTALAWAEALLTLGFPTQVPNELGQLPHHLVLSRPSAAAERDLRQPWLALLGRHGALAWDQPDASGQTPRQALEAFPELLAERRAQDLAQRPAPPPRPRRRI